jgi:dTDP-glucose 4,6-dehydratase
VKNIVHRSINVDEIRYIVLNKFKALTVQFDYIGNPREMTVFELAKTILELTGNRSEILFKPLPVDDPRVRQPDITRARTLLGWEPQVSLTEGLQHTIAYFRAALS